MNGNKIPSFEEWKKLNDEERDYHLYRTLAMVAEMKDTQENLSDKFADKWVEKAAVWVIYSIAGLLLVAFMGLILINTPSI